MVALSLVRPYKQGMKCCAPAIPATYPHLILKEAGQVSRACLFALLLLLPLLLTGCGLLTSNSMDPANSDAAAQPAGTEDATDDDSQWKPTPVPYSTDITVSGADKADAALKGKLEGASQLVLLRKEPPDSLLALERRARMDVETALKLLHSEGYYDGTADFRITEASQTPKAATSSQTDSPPAQGGKHNVLLRLETGPRYTLGKIHIEYSPPPTVPEAFKTRTRPAGLLGLGREPVPPPTFPTELPGLAAGQHFTAGAILDAVEKLPERLRRRGYPLARIVSSRYTLDRAAHQLNIEVVLAAGSPAMLGQVEVTGAEQVNAEYLQRIVPWQINRRPWNSDVLEDYANTLRGLGLFRTVEVQPLPEQAQALGDDGLISLPASVTVKERPFRSISGNARYATDTGLGVEAGWEHRNLFHNGEKLTVQAPFAEDKQGIKAVFEKPAFLSRRQRLQVSGSVLREVTDAYTKEGLSAGGGIERRFSRYWWGGIGLSGESGYLKDNEHSRQDYSVIQPEAHLRFDSRNNVLNPVRGAETRLSFAPFSGFYGQPFSAWAGTLAANFYYAPIHNAKGRPSDKLVLAARLEGGFMSGSSLQDIPSNLRYFAGGASTVRGYAYQAIGPRDSEDEPLGGRSYQIVNLEARFKVTEDVGIVPFLDGGMVYKDAFPHIIGDMDWGAGLGLRYFTPIGPLRFDVATPLRRDGDDAPLQFYISIGQSF